MPGLDVERAVTVTTVTMHVPVVDPEPRHTSPAGRPVAYLPRLVAVTAYSDGEPPVVTVVGNYTEGPRRGNATYERFGWLTRAHWPEFVVDATNIVLNLVGVEALT